MYKTIFVTKKDKKQYSKLIDQLHLLDDDLVQYDDFYAYGIRNKKEKRMTKSEFIEYLFSDNSHVCIMVDKDIVVGYCIIYADLDDKNIIKIENVIVSKEYRHEGFGTSILTIAINYIKENFITAKIISIGSYCENKVAMNIYKKLNFKPYYQLMKLEI
jgi:ribosomal protein S18 acetylase RimI-like enzyme